VGADELVQFDSGGLGLAYELEAMQAGVILLSGLSSVQAGEGVSALGRLPALPVGEGLLGRVIDPLGRPRDDRPPPEAQERPIFREAPSTTERAPVERPLFTGVMVIDASIPIGRGQRQLIVGDRNVGKTALALDIVAAQRPQDVICVYVVIGQPASRVLTIREALLKRGALANTVVIAAEAADSPGLQYLAPYAGMAAAEAFAARGRDALVVFDDLTKHADAYRELALLLGRPPGREAFPGDIFYLHAQLLERATALAAEIGGGSITAFPIVETTDSDISAYIPTNLISITDGQLYLDTARFERNQRPAVDIGRSVSRVGGAAQVKAIRQASKNLRITMARFESLEALTRVGLDVDPATTKLVGRGRALRELLKQQRFTLRSVADQVLALTAVQEGWFDELSPPGAATAFWAVTERLRLENQSLLDALARGAEPEPGWKERVHQLFLQTHGARA
jgi:F-type H+-transporting ATPase subunit alpha